MLKAEWEKSAPLSFDTVFLLSCIQEAFPQGVVATLRPLAQGCANANFIFTLENHTNPYVLRLYLRDTTAVKREQALYMLLQATVPLPHIMHHGSRGEVTYGIASYKEGVTLRDLLLQKSSEDALGSALEDIGGLLVEIQQNTFENPGYLLGNLAIDLAHPLPFYLDFVESCLAHPHALKGIGEEKIGQIHDIMHAYEIFLPLPDCAQLVHGDFDPANILVKKSNDKWEVSAILDWEFAYAGSGLFDVSNMLRYAHLLPPFFKTRFIRGIEKTGLVLPPQWEITTRMLGIVSLLDLLTRHDPEKCPRQTRDIRSLLTHSLDVLRTYS